jgi:hypothetical protein
MECLGVSVIQRNQPKGVKPNIRGRQLSGVYMREALKHTGIKQVGRTTKAMCIRRETSHSASVHYKSHMTWPGTEPKPPR